MRDKIVSYFEEHKDEMIRDIIRLIAVRSVKGEPEEGMPFGRGPAEAVACVEEIAERLGLQTKNFDNYMLTVNLNDNPTALGILSHLDVVHEGTGWSSPPYEAEIRDGMLFGRGAADNKGPALSALYALKAAKELGGNLSKNVRLMLGTDEESGMSDLKYYFTRETPPPHSFSPDAAFPVYNLEKGGLRTNFTAEFEAGDQLPKIVKFSGGHTVNIVAEEAEVLLVGLDLETVEKFCREYAEKTGLKITACKKEDFVTVKAKGAGTHASYPEYGNNAVTGLLSMLSAMPFADSEGFRRIKGMSEVFPHNDYYGKAAGIAMEDELSGPLTVSFDILRYEETKLEGFFDIRSPICSNEENTSEVLAKALADRGMHLATTEMIKPHHVPEDCGFIQVLLKRYEDFTGLKGECVSMGGGTYVHGIEGSVAFGPSYPETETYAHGPDERIVIEELMAGAEMYTQIILDICK